MSVFAPPAERRDALRTDLYQLTMAAALVANGRDDEATFELYTRRLPRVRGYWVACGLETALDYLEGLRLQPDQVDWLARHPSFAAVPRDVLDRLARLRFTGDVWALPEGTPFFPNEPVLRVTAPVVEAQLVETYLLSLVNFQTLVCSKATRVAQACRGKKFVDFGMRRAHGPEAGELVARASFVGGASGTSNVEAGMRLGVPVYGTFAHSWVMMWDDEVDAFQRYARLFPHATTLLIDTYDTVAAARRVVAGDIPCKAVRLDSGDLGQLSRDVRRIFDEGGRKDIQVMASGDLEELKIAALEAEGAAIDIYGVGTELATSRDYPALGGVYKVVETRRAGSVRHPVKLAQDKASFPGRKQLLRRFEGGEARGDVIALEGEQVEGAEPQLVKVMEAGRRLRPAPSLEALREQCRARVATLPVGVRRLEAAEAYPVAISPGLEALTASAREAARARFGLPGGVA